jgi:tape measure domain-containing protein
VSGIDVPISLPTDASSVSSAASVVKSLSATLIGIGPAAASGASSAVAAISKVAAASNRAAASAKAQANALERIGAKKSAGIEIANAKGFQAAQLGAQKILGDLGKQRAKQEGAVELAAIKGSIQQQSQARAQAHAQEMARIKARAQAEGRSVKVAKPTAPVKGAAGGSGFDLNGLLGGAATGIVAALSAVYVALGVLSARFAVALVSAQAFKEGTQLAFTKLLGSATAANATFRSTVAIAGQIGVGFKDALQGVNALMAKGFKADEAQNLVKAMADLKAVVPDANIGNLLLAISQIKSKGVLQMEELQGQIAEAGLSVSVVLEEIGKKIGKSAAEVRKMISAGKISADAGVAGIMAAIQKTTGQPLGKAAEDASKTLGGLIARAQDLPGAILMMAEPKTGLERLKGALSNVLAAFAPGTASGDRFAAALGGLGDAFSSVLTGITGKGGADALTGFVEGMSGAIKSLSRMIEGIGAIFGPVLGGLIKGLGEGMKAGNRGSQSAVSSAESYAQLGRALGQLAEVAGKAIGWLVSLGLAINADNNQDTAGGLAGKIDSIVSAAMAVQAVASAIYSSAISIGNSLVAGIIAGINMAAPGLMGVVGALANMTTASFKAPVAIASPSGVWRDEIGYQLPAGAAQGVAKGAPLLLNAAGKLAVQTTGAGSLGNGGQATGGRSVVIEGGVHFHGMTRSDADFFDARMRNLLREVA